MASEIKKIILLLIGFLLYETADAQILMEKKDVILLKGSNYSTGIDESGNEYLEYNEEEESFNDKTYTRTSIYYFKRYRDSIDVCTHEKHIFPDTAAYLYLLWLEDTKLKTGDLRWKDTATQYIYKAQFTEPFFTITIWKDGVGVIEKFANKDRKFTITIE